MSEEVQPTSSSPVTLAASCAVGAAAWYMLLLADSAALPVDVFVSTPASTPAVALSAWDSSVCSFSAAWVFGLLPLLFADRRRLPAGLVIFAWVSALQLPSAFLAPCTPPTPLPTSRLQLCMARG
jgi:hypothetical protein